MIGVVPTHRKLADHPGAGFLDLGDEISCEFEILLDPQSGHARPLSANIRIVGETVEIDAEVAYLDDLHLTPAHVIEDQIGRRQVPVFDDAIEPKSCMHCLSRFNHSI